MIYLKFFLFSIITYIILIFSTYNIYFDDYTNHIIKEQKEISNIKFDLFRNSIEGYIRNNKISKVSDKLEEISNTNLYNYIYIDYVDYYVTTNSILSHANKKTPISWYINDVSIDSRYGEIKQINTNTYKIVNSNKNVFKELIKIKSQATNQHIIKDIISTLNFKLPSYKNKNTNIQQNNILKRYLQIKNEKHTSYIFINEINKIAKIQYELNINIIYEKIYNQLFDILLFISILYILLLFCIFVFNYLILQNNINRTIGKLIVYTNDIINNNYYKFDYKKLPYKNTKKLSLNISILSKKMASIVNELNINKNILEAKISTDALTNLANSKMLNNDLKTLFLIKDSAYIIKIKLEYLKEFANKEDEVHVNNLILDFVKIINNTINNMFNSDSIKLYRLYGSDFIIIYNNANYEDIEKLSKDLKINIKNDLILDKINKIYHLISFPFDKYSNTKSIIDKSSSMYKDTITFDKQITSYIEKNEELDKKNTELERVITSIIKTNSFSLSYKYDTYSYENNELIMQEVSANLLNFDGTNIPIGTFISVAEENNLAIDFDKQLIIKTFEYIKNNNIKHKLAINISIDALKNDDFVFWLESQMLFEYKELMKNVVFSITSFAAKNFFLDFLDFTSQIKKFNGQILLKRFSYDDFSQEQLEQLSIDYIRVHKDYTNNIDKHRKSILNNIKNYCISSNIQLLGDVVSNQNDNEILKALSFYGTSK